MTAKEMLAQLASNIDLPLDKYTVLDAAVALSKNFDLLSKLESFHLPEVTKLICGSPALTARYGESYRHLVPFFSDNSLESMLTRFGECDKDSTYYITHIFPLADNHVLNSFVQAFNRIDKRIKNLKDSIEKANNEQSASEEKIKDLQAQLVSMNAQLDELSKDSLDEKYRQKRKDISYTEGVLTKEKNKLANKKKLVNSLFIEREQLQKQYICFLPAYNHAKKVQETYQESLSKSRAEAFSACDHTYIMHQIIQNFISSGAGSSELEIGLTKYTFCVQFLSVLSTKYLDRSIDILSALYDLGYIDILDAPFSTFLASNPYDVSCFFMSKYYNQEGNKFMDEKENFEGWCDFIITKAFFETEDPLAFEGYDYLWEHIPSASCWKSFLDTIKNISEENLIQYLAILLLRTTGTSRRHLITVTLEMIRQEEIESVASVVTALIDNHIKGDDCSVIAELLVQKIEGENRKLAGINERLTYNANCISSKAYSALAKPVENLEILASNISTRDSNIAPEIVASKFKKLLIDLRESLEIFDIYTLEKPDKWIAQTPEEFNPDIHSISFSTPPNNVYIRTLGFKYKDVIGNTKTAPAIVGRLQDLQTASSPNNKKSKSNSKGRDKK